jgi:hypothetical protein
MTRGFLEGCDRLIGCCLNLLMTLSLFELIGRNIYPRHDELNPLQKPHPSVQGIQALFSGLAPN